ncbi:MAG: hypothetical protein DWQ02_15995 [Bacteroidetes bacterium]|nr:MAG: hypothetical protein DWQ02_15995 [Bacteroidota bacterium]
MIKKTIILLVLVSSFNALWAQTALKSEKCLTKNNVDDRYASYSPDGNWIVFESNREGYWHIFLMDSKGQNEQKLTTNSADNRRPSWHPNGKKILFESNRSGKFELYTLKVKNREVRKLQTPTENGELIFATYSPNGKNIAVSFRESEDRSNIILLKRTGKLVRWLTTEDRRSFYPKWSNDGKEIVYFSRKETENQDDEIYRLNIKTGVESRLTNWAKHNFCPSWSFNNSRIVYVTSMEDLRPEIYIMDADGSNKTRITNNEDGDTLPNWHPKENRILITAYRAGNFEICELELH